MQHTKIEWVRNPDGSTPGYSWSPITGCSGPKGDGVHCPYCYARRLANGRLKARYLENKNTAPRCYGVQFVEDLLTMSDPFYPRFWPERLLKSAKGLSAFIRTSRKGIFVCDMSDLFGIGIPESWTKKVLEQIKIFSQHRFYLLTKQPQNLINFSPFPPNAWVGVTATNCSMFSNAMFWLRQVRASVKYLSLEPLMERILPHYIGGIEGINQLIIGAQTRPNVYPKIEWVDEIVKAADSAGVAVFLKDNLEPLWTLENRREPFFKFSRPSPGATEIGHLRQEMPVIEEK